MEVETRRKENGTMIQVQTDHEVAVAVYTDGDERIYLPGGEGSDSTYYNEDPTFLAETGNGYAVLHPANPDSIQLIN
ncbi:MAG: hypothetical protein ABEJ36_06275 [Candidatus Nanosalina sp.]